MASFPLSKRGRGDRTPKRAIDVVVQKNPRYILHGHEPLTRNFSSPEMLAQLKGNLGWLRDQVMTAIPRGDTRAAIHQANLIPPGFLNGRPDTFLPYLILREHVIDRLYHQNVGYWQADLEGLDHLGDSDRAELLVDYLGLSEQRLVTAAQQLAADGKYELAASLLESSSARFGHTESIAKVERLVYLKLMEKYQNTDPFKYILYSAKIGEQTPAMTAVRRTCARVCVVDVRDRKPSLVASPTQQRPSVGVQIVRIVRKVTVLYTLEVAGNDIELRPHPIRVVEYVSERVMNPLCCVGCH